MRSQMTILGWLVIAAWLGACGGTQPGPEAPAEEPKAAADELMEDAANAADAGAEPDTAEEEATSETESDPPMRSPKDILTADGVLFSFLFNASEPYQKAEKRCDAKSGDDPQKRAQCMSKARKQFEGDTIGFKKDDEGSWWWFTIQKRGSKLKTLHRIQVDFTDETDKSVTLTTKGRDKGSKPMGRVPKKVVIEVPSESEIVITDPKHGKMVYEAKMGLIGEAQR